MILLIIYCSITWSDFVLDEDQKYKNGFAYPVILLLTILYNLTYISMELYNNNKSINRKIGAQITKLKELFKSSEDSSSEDSE